MSVPVARRNTLHQKGKLVMSVLSMIAAISLIMLLVGLRAGMYATITAFVDHLGADLVVAQSGVKGIFSSDSSVAADIHAELEQEVGAVEGGHILVADIIFSEGDAKTPVILVGYDQGSAYGSPWLVGEGRYIEAPGEIMLDTWLASRSEIQVGDRISLLGEEFNVVGLTLETSSWMSPYIFLSLADAEQVLGVSGVVSYHLFTLPDRSAAASAVQSINLKFDNLEALTPEEVSLADRRVVAAIMDLPIIILLVIAVVIGAAVMGLTAYTSVSDRLREYGVLKAVGASQLKLVQIVVQETLYQAALAFLLAVGVSFAAAWLIMNIYPQFNVLIEPKVILQTGVLTILMAVVSAIFPLAKLKRIDPILVFKS